VTRYRFDPALSRVWIEARSTLHPIRAQTAGVEGWFDATCLADGRVDPAVAPRAQLSLPVDLLSSGNAFYDREMRRRVESRRFPLITGDLTSIESGDGRDRYLIRGDLTFRGITRSYTDEMTLSSPDGRTLLMTGNRTFDIRDFGLEAPRILGMRVHPEVAVKILVVAEPTSARTVPTAGAADPS
jgi:polyisoprenoid-binding protein YceI